MGIDPHVERLIEAVAFLNSRIPATLDDAVPEISTALLEILYPHMMAPIPAMAIARFEAKADAAGQPRRRFDVVAMGGARQDPAT